MASFVRVFQTEMLFTTMIQFLCILTVSFHVWAAIVSVVIFLLPYMLVYAYSMPEATEEQQRKKFTFQLAFKILNVLCTFNAFMMLFASDMYFDVSEDIVEYQKSLTA